MFQQYYYAIGKVFQTLDHEGEIAEDYAFLDAYGDFSVDGIETATVYEDEHQAIRLAQEVYGRVVRVHHEFVEQYDIDIEENQ